MNQFDGACERQQSPTSGPKQFADGQGQCGTKSFAVKISAGPTSIHAGFFVEARPETCFTIRLCFTKRLRLEFLASSPVIAAPGLRCAHRVLLLLQPFSKPYGPVKLKIPLWLTNFSDCAVNSGFGPTTIIMA